VAILDEEWVGLLAWRTACYALQDRDQYIGWTPTLRAERQKLVVQNRRFLLLGKKGAQPNLASRILGASVKALPEQWRAYFGYVPLLAETFTDIETFADTCYKAAGWVPLGRTKGFSRRRADFFVPNDRPKKLWVKPLRKNAVALLRALELPAAHQPGAASSAHGVMSLRQPQIESLHDHFSRVPDPRAANREFHIGAVLAIVAMALLSGQRDISRIMRFGWRLTQAQRKSLGLPRKDGKKFYRVPGYKVYYNLLSKLNPDTLAESLSAWLRAQHGTLPAALAPDGKMIRETVGIVCLADHKTGVPHAMACMSMKESEGDRCEMKTAQKMIVALPDLNHKLVTADALHCQAATAQAIVAQGGDYLLQVKDNQKTVRALAEADMTGLPPFLPGSKKNTVAKHMTAYLRLSKPSPRVRHWPCASSGAQNESTGKDQRRLRACSIQLCFDSSASKRFKNCHPEPAQHGRSISLLTQQGKRGIRLRPSRLSSAG
jgi:hypothetical protein